MYCESRNGRISTIAHITPNSTRIYPCHGSVVFDIIGFKHMLNFRCSESLSESLSVDEFYMYLLEIMREEFLAGTFGSLVPFFVVFMILYSCKSRSREVGSDGELPPSWRDIGSTSWNPYGNPTHESMQSEEFLGGFGIDPLKFHELHIFSEYPLHPPETSTSFERDSMDMTIIPEILVVDGGSCSIIGMVFGEFSTLYGLHNFREIGNFSSSIEIKIKSQKRILLFVLQKIPRQIRQCLGKVIF